VLLIESIVEKSDGLYIVYNSFIRIQSKFHRSTRRQNASYLTFAIK